MLSSVLRSKRAIQVNIQIMGVFTRLRQLILEDEDIRRDLPEMRKQTEGRFQLVFETLDQLLNMDEEPRKKIGFEVKEKKAVYGKKKEFFLFFHLIF